MPAHGHLALIVAHNDNLVLLDHSGHLVLIVFQAGYLGGLGLPAVYFVEWVSVHGHLALLVVHDYQRGVLDLCWC